LTDTHPFHPNQILKGALFSEPMRVETVRAAGSGTWSVGLVGMQTERFRSVTLTDRDIESLTILDTISTFEGDGQLLRLGLQAYALGIAYEFDPYFGLSISRVDPLPHQLAAVYDHLLKLARVRFLLADDAGAGKTIMAGLLVRELKLRGLVERVLVICPANLTFQWQRELKEKFDEKFLVLKGGDIRDQFGVNQWMEQKQTITSLDLAKREDILPGLKQVHWDLVIVDEAHRMSWSPPARKTARYALGELLRDTTDHLLLLTATPHKGDPENFSLFLQLLDRDAYADVRSVRAAIERRSAPFYLRRTKEAMVYFPERQPDLPAPRRGEFYIYVLKCADGSFYIGQTDNIPRRLAEHESGKASWTAPRRPLQLIHWEIFDSREAAVEREQHLKTGFGRQWLKREYEAGRLAARQAGGTWVARKIFTKRIPHTVDFQIDGAEFELYRDVTRFVKRQSAQAAAREDSRARAVGFLMSLYQRRLASSTYSLRHSLENRARRLEDALKRANELAQQTPPELPDSEDIEEMEDADRERLEEILEAITLTGNADQVREEIAQLNRFAQQAKAVEDAGTEAKLARLNALLHTEGFFDHPDQRLLLFTEFKDTLDYLVTRLKEWGFRVGVIHGGMRIGSRNEPGTRLCTEQQFKDGDIQILVATEAAGEGINLQCCHILFNYDIPWNPNRLEQRMGRIHRYGQLKDCLIFNFVATNTIEGHVLRRLLEKLQEIRNALDDDAVFNVVGEVLPAAHVERVLRDYYAGKLGDADLEERLLRNVDESQFRAICQNALEGLATKNLNLEMLIERRARAQERRVVPETIARFVADASRFANLDFKPVAPACAASVAAGRSLPHTFDVGRLPNALRRYERDADWRLPPLANRYPRCSTVRETAEEHNYEWVTPGHPLFEALRRHTLELARESFGKGACFYSLQHDAPARIDFYRAKVVDGLGQVTHERLFAVEIPHAARGEPSLREPSILGDFSPVDSVSSLAVVDAPDLPAATDAAQAGATDWLNAQALMPFLGEVRAERLAEIEHIAKHVELSLTELIQKADEDIGRANEEIERGVQGAEGRLAQAETRHAELLARREQRRHELERQRSLTLQGVERITSVLVLPHPERESPEVRHLRPDYETEAIAMQVVMDYERAQGRQVYDVHEKNLGYDLTSLDLNSGELRLIEVKGLGDATGTILLTPNERRVAEDRRDCYWLYVVTNCNATAQLQEPIRDPARFPWHEVVKVQHYWLEVNAMTKPMRLREQRTTYGEER
jgi:superfamily II DNA or RNA helicase/predicted GIY-YIG superfamily endonuclease